MNLVILTGVRGFFSFYLFKTGLYIMITHILIEFSIYFYFLQTTLPFGLSIGKQLEEE